MKKSGQIGPGGKIARLGILVTYCNFAAIQRASRKKTVA
jgi:hypothetical protein